MVRDDTDRSGSAECSSISDVLENRFDGKYLLTTGDVQDLGQLSEVSGDFFQQKFEAVSNDMNLLFGLQAVAALRVDQQLEGHVL